MVGFETLADGLIMDGGRLVAAMPLPFRELVSADDEAPPMPSPRFEVEVAR